jgi:hypothetical protein
MTLQMMIQRVRFKETLRDALILKMDDDDDKDEDEALDWLK